MNVETGVVTLEDAKYSVCFTPGARCPTIDQFDEIRHDDWIREAKGDIRNSPPPPPTCFCHQSFCHPPPQKKAPVTGQFSY